MDFCSPVLGGQNGRGGTFVEMAAGIFFNHPIGRIWDMHTQVYIHHFHHIFCHYLLSLLFILCIHLLLIPYLFSECFSLKKKTLSKTIKDTVVTFMESRDIKNACTHFVSMIASCDSVWPF